MARWRRVLPGSRAWPIESEISVRIAAVLIAAALAGQVLISAQTTQPKRPPARRPNVPPKIEEAMVNCPTVLGEGANTGRMFCDVLIQREPRAGIIIKFPPHTGDVTLSFTLHNRHTYSEEEVKNKRAYHRYTASIGVMALDNTLLSRAVVQNEFRTASDLVDRVRGGSGAGGLKAVAPTGAENIVLTIPETEQGVSLLGEKLSVIRVDGKDEFTTQGRPIAVISNVMIEYRPAPARPAPARRKVTRALPAGDDSGRTSGCAFGILRRRLLRSVSEQRPQIRSGRDRTIPTRPEQAAYSAWRASLVPFLSERFRDFRASFLVDCRERLDWCRLGGRDPVERWHDSRR